MNGTKLNGIPRAGLVETSAFFVYSGYTCTGTTYGSLFLSLIIFYGMFVGKARSVFL